MITSRDAGHLLEELLERHDVEGEQPHRRLRHHARVAGLVAHERHLPDDRPGPIVGDVLAAERHAGLTVDHEEALGAHVALVHEDRRPAPRRPARRVAAIVATSGSCTLAKSAQAAKVFDHLLIDLV